LGLISDIHGNRVSLDAVVADGTAEGVDRWWVLGDLVAIGPEPMATLCRLRDLPGARFVRGNTDRYTVTGARPYPHPADVERDPSLRPLFEVVEGSFAWTLDQLDADARAWLAGLPGEQRADLPDGTRLLAIHASPRSDDGVGITPHLEPDRLAELLHGSDADIVCGGHTHQPTDRVADGVRAVNLGSVSNPMTEDLRSTYVIIDADRHGHRLAHRRVAYSHDEVIARARRTDHPDVEHLVSYQRGGQVKYPAWRPGSPRFEQ
jgi:predicted phosphodiesterase